MNKSTSKPVYLLGGIILGGEVDKYWRYWRSHGFNQQWGTQASLISTKENHARSKRKPLASDKKPANMDAPLCWPQATRPGTVPRTTPWRIIRIHGEYLWPLSGLAGSFARLNVKGIPNERCSRSQNMLFFRYIMILFDTSLILFVCW